MTDESEIQGRLEAVRQRGGGWHLWAYDSETDRLVLKSHGPWPSRSRREPDLFLVCRSPRYVRLDSPVDDLDLITGAKALAVMRRPSPASVPTESLNVLLSASGEREFCVVCESVACYFDRGEARFGRVATVPLTVRGQASVALDREYRPIDQQIHLGKIQGATLRWHSLSVFHTILIMVATGLLGEPFALYFGYTQWVHCPTTMHNVRLRMATAEEIAALQRFSARAESVMADEEFLSNSNVAWVPREGLLVIECDEGVFSVWGGVLFLSWRDAVNFDLHVPDVLWRGGPPLAEL